MKIEKVIPEIATKKLIRSGGESKNQYSLVVVNLLKITREITADYRTAKTSYKGRKRINL